MRTFPGRVTVAVAAVAAAVAVAVAAPAQADAAVRYTSVVDGRAIASTSQSSIPTLVAASGSTTQQWIKTSVGGGFFTLRGVSSGRCLAGSSFLPFMTTCDASKQNQHWHRGFVSDKRLENRASRTALTASAFRLEMRVLSGLQSQRWNELLA